MSSDSQAWKQHLGDRIDPALSREIDAFETQLELRLKGKIDEKTFAETRLRRGAYGQRYDNGQRHDGTASRPLGFDEAKATKGPDTFWDAPGMQRIKIPMGVLTPDQMDVLAEVAEEYSDAVLHVTTRQDLQLHYVQIDDTPALMRRLGAAGITTREACGNTVRNVTACPVAGVCRDETFDVTPYAEACTRFLLGHPDAQDFGRKFKISFSGCAHKACGLAAMHDAGCIAVTREENGTVRRGWAFYVGGGLGAVPHQAVLYDAFLPVEDLLPTCQAIARVFARLGEKANRNRARLKFLVAKLGIDEFRRLVEEEKAALPPDPRWTAWLAEMDEDGEHPLRALDAPVADVEEPSGEAHARWRATNVEPQRQPGYVAVTVAAPLGDVSSRQMRALAGIARDCVGETVRMTVDQNFLLRWVREADLPALFHRLDAVALAEPGAGTLVDVTACPGTDTCKLGIASSRGLAAELRRLLAEKAFAMDESARDLTIKISGCFNACGQHHVSDIGFYGISRKVGAYTVPHFQVVLGGKRRDNADAYGLAILAIPSKRIPDVVLRITEAYVAERDGAETFQEYVHRVGKPRIREMLMEYKDVPAHDVDASYYSDWGDPREFTLGDMGVGECAGEVVPLVQFGLAASEGEVFEAQVQLDDGDFERARALALSSMVEAAKALVKTQLLDVPDDRGTVVAEFRTRFYDTEVFFDPYAKGKFAQYLFRQVDELDHVDTTRDIAHRAIEEAQLFIEAAHACYGRMAEV